MIKVIIADDERIIREGLAFGVDWRSLDMQVMGLAGDGREAYEKILEANPELVIIDIQMPEMSGLEVIKAVRDKLGDNVTFIILSGYSEFSYAQQAMSYGAVEYLLKPTDDDELFKTLQRVGKAIEKEKKRLEFEAEMRRNMERQMPILREHIIKDYITNSYFETDDFEYYKNILDFDIEVRLVIYHIANEASLEEIFSLKSLICQKLYGKVTYTCISIKNHLLIVINAPCPDEELIPMLTDINNYFHEFYDSSLHVIHTHNQPMNLLPYVYSQLVKCIGYSFYLSDEYIIGMEEILRRDDIERDTYLNNYTEIIDCIRSGNIELTESLVNTYFDNLTNARLAVHITKTYLTELYMGIIRCMDSNDADEFVRETLTFSQADSLDEIKKQIMRLALSVAESNYDDISESYSKNIGQAIRYVNEHLDDNTMTLKYLCNNVLFINVDYFGRLFKKETGEKFTRYVTLKRIEAAKKLIAEGKITNIFEIAERTGFGDGAQYFSQVFRKITGYTPSEYREKRIYLLENENNDENK